MCIYSMESYGNNKRHLLPSWGFFPCHIGLEASWGFFYCTNKWSNAIHCNIHTMNGTLLGLIMMMLCYRSNDSTLWKMYAF